MRTSSSFNYSPEKRRPIKVNTPKPQPASSDSWWLGLDRAAFYAMAKELFPDDSPQKDARPVETFGAYERDLLAIGRERLMAQARKG